MFMWCFSTKLQLIKISIALESTSTCIENVTEVSVVSRATRRYWEISWVLRVLIVRYRSNFFSHLECLVEAAELAWSIQTDIFKGVTNFIQLVSPQLVD